MDATATSDLLVLHEHVRNHDGTVTGRHTLAHPQHR
jgi:hypothetical protein